MDSGSRPYHKSLKLENFTAFREAEFEFVPGINVIIGENGTGKTHVLKALYAGQLSWLREESLERIFPGVFLVEDHYDLVSIEFGNKYYSGIIGEYGKSEWYLDTHISENDIDVWFYNEESLSEPDLGSPIFIPAVDMMGHTKGFISTFDNYKIDFDLTHREIVSLLLSPEKRELDEESKALVRSLSDCLGGTLELKGERFYLKTPNGSLPMPSVAEGLRKIATLIRLVQTGWLAPGSTLFWDEPEVNLNPKLMDEVVGAIIALARSGVQVIMATHSYVILKELDLQLKEGDSARFFSLSPSDNGTQVAAFDSFAELTPNAILDQYASLYDREIIRATGRNLSNGS